MPLHRQRVLIGYHDDGTAIYRRLQAYTEDEMNDKIVQAYIDSGRIWEFIDRDNHTQPQTQTPFKPYVDNWLSVYKAPKLKPRTLQTYKGYLTTHIFPAFGDRLIESITTQDIQQFLNDRKEQTRKSLKEYLALLKQIFNAAVEDKLITDNPTSSSRLMIPSDREVPREALTRNQYGEIIEAIRSLDDKNAKKMLALLAFTGMRRGEVLGLQWEDVDTENNFIHVRRNVTHPGNAPVIGTPKTKRGTRDIPLSSQLQSILEPMRGEGFIFGGNRPISLKAYDTIMKRIKRHVNLHGATAHVFRHTYLTMAEGANIDPKTLQTIAGHADIRTTMNTYVHPQMENVVAAGLTMDNLLNKLAANT